jgi:hypothetical protein
MPCMPTWESCEPLIATIRQSLEKIWVNKFMPISEYRRRVEAGALAKRQWFHGDQAFQKQYPDHPLAANHRFARIEAANAIRDASKQINRPLPDDILVDLHKALFDCCGPVRLSLTEALFLVGSPKSIPVIERLIEVEPESKMVRGAAKVTLERCRMRDPAYAFTEKRAVMVVTDNMDLVVALIDISKRFGFQLFIPDPPFHQLTTMRSDVLIIDRWYMGKTAWDLYCDHLDGIRANGVSLEPAAASEASAQSSHLLPHPTSVQGNTTRQSGPRESQVSLLGGLSQDDTPLIIIDWHMQRSVQEFRDPNKPKYSVFYVEGGSTDIVVLIVKKVMQGIKPIDFAAVIKEVNEDRLAGR